MFKIIKLTMYSFDEKEYTYQFSLGLNYFKGKNSSGKTEFYNFLDFMFGSSEDIRKKPWYRDSLKKASMQIQVDNIIYTLTRSNDPSQNYISYADEIEMEAMDQREYKAKLNAIFTKNMALLRNIREFAETELSFRTFTMFNFLGEKRQGAICDFFDKCSDIKYSVKLAPILNFIFNNNLEKIYLLQRNLEELQEKLKELEIVSSRYDFICTQVNRNIQKLGSNIWYTGKNADVIRENIKEIKNMEETKRKNNDRSTEQGEMAQSIVKEFEILWMDEASYSYEEFSEVYRKEYKRKKQIDKLVREQQKIALQEDIIDYDAYKLKPNKMQGEFICRVHDLIERGAKKALLIIYEYIVSEA